MIANRWRWRVTRKGAAWTAGLLGVALVALAGAWTFAMNAAAQPMRLASASMPWPSDGYGDRSDLFVVTDDNRLYRYDRLGAGRQDLEVAITGLAAGERLVGIDTRPANGQLYGVGSTSQLYVIDPATGVASPVGGPFATPLAGNRFGVDFNPTVDRLRLVSDTGQNLRVNPTTGALAVVDSPLSSGDGATPAVTAAAYTNSVAGATATALYDIDSGRDLLVLQGTKPGVTPAVSPNTGQLFPVGKLGTDVVGLDGFEIVGAAKAAAFNESDYTALAAVRIRGGKTVLVRIDLRTGRATYRAKLPVGVVGITASSGAPRTVYATTARNDLVTFDARTRTIRSQQPISGLAAGERVLGIDVRPASGQLYAVGSTNQLYVVNPVTAAATPVGAAFTPALTGSAVGVDFNPTVDRLRVVTTSGQNLRINPDTGAVAAVDKPLAYAAGAALANAQAGVAHAAYTNNLVGATSTTLYDIDVVLDALAIQQPPNDGTLRTVGRLRVTIDAPGGFDIAANGVAMAALARADGTRLYAIDLSSGKARLVGKLGRGSTLTGLAFAPVGSSQASHSACRGTLIAGKCPQGAPACASAYAASRSARNVW